MTYYQNTKIVAFVGLPGAGKSTAVDYLTEKEFPKVYFGGIILKAMNDASIEITPANEEAFREDIRAKEGKDFVVKRVADEVRGLIAAGQHRIILDGLYSWTEYKILKSEFPGIMSVFAVVASKHHRHHRLANRPVRPLTSVEAEERDWTEIEHLEKGGPIAIADHYIINNTSLDDMYEQIDVALNDIEFYE